VLGAAVLSLALAGALVRPLFALGWALLASAAGVAAFLGTLHTTGLLGVAPLLVAVAVTRSRR
jgi:hypothetical protein